MQAAALTEVLLIGRIRFKAADRLDDRRRIIVLCRCGLPRRTLTCTFVDHRQCHLLVVEEVGR